MALSFGYTYLVVCLAPQWIKERGIIDMRVRAKGVLYSVVLRRWRTDIQRWQIDFKCLRTGRWQNKRLPSIECVHRTSSNSQIQN